MTHARTLVVLVLGLSASTLAQTNEAFHFQSDPTRHARVDDRGGLGEGYSFSIDYDPMDGNSEDFCPHCRFTVLVSDPGIDWAELERVGVQRSDITSASSLVTRLQSLTARDPSGLAAELEPTLMGEDLVAFTMQVSTILGHAADALAVLEAFATLQGGSFDWAGADIDELVDALALRMDTAFLGDFSNPNDPRIHNSGVAVFGLADFVSGLESAGVPADVRMSIQSSLSSVPGISGSLEISGDDDSVLAPSIFHGYRTDLTVRQRTYAVNGVSAYLVVLTVVNDTTRVFPLVEASMMADFDIPPLGYDTATEFDPSSQMVAVYDTIPYTDPEQHYWFGLAPASAAAPGAGQFVFANWNIDKNFTLAQLGSSTTQQNRYRFFLFDPAISGDHDDAVGKSEKQGAISMLLTGPLLPGDQRTVAFCYAAGEGNNNGAARAELTVTMTACRALYTALTPSCGDGVLQYGEECDGSADCTSSCERRVCGDGRIGAPEECDDGNTTDGDGCGATCVNEICGNGIVQAGEECDDGNADNTDACTTECRTAACGDGYLRAGACTGADCGCAGYQYCFTGTYTVPTAPRGSVWAPLAGTPIAYRIAFDVTSVDSRTLILSSGRRFTTGPVHVEMSGDPLAASLARALEGRTWTIDVRAAPRTGELPFQTSRLQGAVGRTMVGFELSSAARGLTASLDRSGLPVLESLRFTNGAAQLSVPTALGTLTDVVAARASGTIAPVAAGAAGEECDDGNASDFDACTTACVPAACGDGIVQPSEGEECDLGASPPAWCAGCRRQMVDLCGDGTIDGAIGEVCDDGNRADNDGCSSLCQPESCGDGVVQSSEECDDGANGDNDGCTDACVIERCGDGAVQASEECDTGASVSDTAACLSTCVNATCGDGFVRAGVEDCDDGNTASEDGCSASCEAETCGDGRPGPGETCDDGNAIDGDGCSSACAVEVCGDGRPGPGEQCDDGNLLDGDGCDKDCLLENAAACGDGGIDPGEQCDDGNDGSGDGCSEHCQLENAAACGNGTADPGEECDDGNDRGGDGCTALCARERCGDGIQAFGEGCDDGNDLPGDGCSEACALEPSECGNGVQEYGEQCDGGANCDSDCRATARAPLGDTCGDGTLDFGEQCDDGGRMDGNGCDELCQLEASVCGNGRIERGETCDDGNAAAGDGCDASCAYEGTITPPPPPAGGCGGCATPRRVPGTGAWLVLAGLFILAGARRKKDC